MVSKLQEKVNIVGFFSDAVSGSRILQQNLCGRIFRLNIFQTILTSSSEYGQDSFQSLLRNQNGFAMV